MVVGRVYVVIEEIEELVFIPCIKWIMQVHFERAYLTLFS